MVMVGGDQHKLKKGTAGGKAGSQTPAEKRREKGEAAQKAEIAARQK